MTGLTQKLTLSAVFVALGILFPVLFHTIGLGSVFLPMFWPVAVAGMLLPFPNAVLVGVLTPVLSFALTGMPPASPPILYVMAAELACLSGTIAMLMSRTRWGLFWILFLSLLLSRIVLFLLSRILAPILGLPPNWISWYSVLKGLPGAAVMLAVVPAIVGRLKHHSIWRNRSERVPGA
ncbi:MAG TPA: ECF transporter S component [bacterium]